ncbi:MAG: TlpA family protein disulfide reductase [Clostridia bacterium]|nr:TlpA family protein disulfide reductase [Clostridia bacterium]
MNKKGLIVLIIAFALVIVGASLLYNKFSKDNEPENLLIYEEKEGELENEEKKEEFMAPDFTVYDKDGNAVKLSDLKGKPVVLNFWASWCPPRKREMPDFNEKYLELGDNVHFMMVNITDGYQETKASAEKYLATTNYSFPVYFDTDLDGAYTYGISSVPQTFFIDENGVLITMAQGAIRGNSLQKGIDLIYEKSE